MGNSVFEQFVLPGKAAALPTNLTIKRLKLSFEMTSAGISFFFEGASDPTIGSGVGGRTTMLDFEVEKDCIVEIELDQNWAWHWSNHYAAVTTKHKYKTPLYHDLFYSEDGKNFFKYNTVMTSANIRFVAFVADFKSNGDISNGERHPFSLNIDLVNRNGFILPVTIDPDIKNPPIPPELSAKSHYLSAVPA